jgi:IclR family pca regulon transcriptional regulator
MNQSALKQSVVHEIFRSGDSDYMVSLARGLHVIQAFCDDGRGQLTIAEINRISGLSRTVVSRCLYTLQELGFVGRDGRNFFLLPKVLKLGYGYVAAADLPVLAQPILNMITEGIGSASAVSVLEGDEVLYVAKSAPASAANIVALSISIGNRRPAHETASGLVILANLNEAEFNEYLENLDGDEAEKRDEIETRVRNVKREGFAQLGLVFATSMRAIAVPIKNIVGKTVAAMVVAIYDEHSSDKELEAKYLSMLQKSAQNLSMKLV